MVDYIYIYKEYKFYNKMKKVVITKSGKDYISDLPGKNKFDTIYCDTMGLWDLCLLAKSQCLDGEEKLLVFDASIIKINAQITSLIKETHHNVIILSEDEKKIPLDLRRICEREIIDDDKKIQIFDIIGNLGKPNINLDGIKSFPLGQLVKYLNVNWKKFDNGLGVYDLLLEINKKLYKVGDDYLYLYLMYGFPEQKRKTFFRYPTMKKTEIKVNILKKIGDYYGYSVKEVTKMWWLIKKVVNSDLADKYRLTDAERKVLGLKKKEKITEVVKSVKPENKVKSKSLLDI